MASCRTQNSTPTINIIGTSNPNKAPKTLPIERTGRIRVCESNLVSCSSRSGSRKRHWRVGGRLADGNWLSQSRMNSAASLGCNTSCECKEALTIPTSHRRLLMLAGVVLAMRHICLLSRAVLGSPLWRPRHGIPFLHKDRPALFRFSLFGHEFFANALNPVSARVFADSPGGHCQQQGAAMEQPSADRACLHAIAFAARR